MSDTISAEMFGKMFISGTKSLESKKDTINELNVFPVPDGDTGTNMTLTLVSAIDELSALPEDPSLEMSAKAIAAGALKGARGNSGVILSQLLRGFASGLSDIDELDKAAVAKAAALADEMSRKAVMNPKEGTILTVAKAAADKAGELSGEDISMEDFLKEIIAKADLTLSRTPEMLPVLKEAGVVDSGGAGLLEFLKGAYEAYTGTAPNYDINELRRPKQSNAATGHVDSSDIETSDIKFGYCTEFIVNLKKSLSLNEENEFKAFLESIGDSVVFVCTEEVVKIHVHTNHPGLVFEKGLEFGELSGMKIDNMREEHRSKLALESATRSFDKEYAFVSVCSGEGLTELFRNLSVNEIIEGGQTMNPSAEDIAGAIRNTRAENVFVLPNNGNVILTAKQAKELCPEVNVYVIPTRTIPEGISAVINYAPALTASENAAHMEEETGNLKTAVITVAVRDSDIDGISIMKDDHMAVSEGHIVAADKELKSCVLKTLEAITDEDSEIISIYYGEDVSEALAEEIEEEAEKLLPDADIELVNGGQPVYHFLLSVE